MATNKRKRAELLVRYEDGEEAEDWITRAGQEEKIDEVPTGGCVKHSSEEDRQKTMVLDVVHLLVIASKHTSSDPRFQKSVMVSITSIRHFLSSSTIQVESLVFQGLLAAMPALLCHRENFIVVRSIALLGDMAFHSYQSVLQIINETQVLRNLLGHLTSANAEVQKEACHAIASIASAPQGQRALCGLGAVQKLMHLLFVVTGFVVNSVNEGEVTRSLDLSGELYLLSETEVLLLSGVLEALNMLTCSSFYESFGRVAQGSRVSILKALQIMWKRFRNSFYPPLQGDHVRVLAKMIVWLAMEQDILDEGSNDGCKNVVEILFGGMETEFEHFWDEHWERSPFLMDASGILGLVCSNLLRAWHGDGDSVSLRKLLTTTSACPPFSCDELETSQIYKEIEQDLGRPLVFGQDIRLVKSVCTNGCMEPCLTHTVLEEDYHKVDLGKSHEESIGLDADSNTCGSAYQQGYTIALRGLEFRCPHIAALAEALAVCLGQATVGANLYMTPLNAQGFKPHYDDHCVLVWQLTGWKAWKLWAPEVFLPRLYSQDTELKRVCTDEEGACKISLKEGDILYIPRGFPHAATTQVNEQMPAPTKVDFGTQCCLQSEVNRKKHAWDPLAPYFSYNCSCMQTSKDSQQAIERNMVHSLHITFGVEVEAPFDWEGLIHMSVQCWATKQNWDKMLGKSDSGARTCHSPGWYKGLLHVAIRQCGDRCSAFRKACLIAAKPPHKEAYNADRSESFFKELIQSVANGVAFKEVFHTVLTAIDTPASTSLHWMHWLRHLSGEDDEQLVWSDPITFFYDRLIDSKARTESLEDMEVRFNLAKDSFVSSASYAEAHDCFIGLLHKYRNVRRKHTKGMLALHV